MKRFICTFIVFIFCCTAPAFAFNPDELNTITFQNSTGYDISRIFLSPGDSEFWGPEILGPGRMLQTGESIGFYIEYPGVTTSFDIMAMDEAGYTFILWDCQISDEERGEISLEFEDLLEEPPDFEFITLNLKNETVPVYLLFVTPRGSEMWGVDLLNEYTVLDSGSTFSFLVPAGASALTYKVLTVDEDMDEYVFDLLIDPRTADSTGTVDKSISLDDLQTVY